MPSAARDPTYTIDKKALKRAAVRSLALRTTAMPHRISRAAYAEMFGPTIGDKVRLADTELIVEVEQDFTIYGEEVKFGGGKVIRDGMGQCRSPAPRAPSTRSSPTR